ncbi:MAG: GntR family transcriptional regulator [Dethiosulfatibacter sp.]|nr:GntR family transcriptional regulator [Dethiosulfatibacter sp.]
MTTTNPVNNVYQYVRKKIETKIIFPGHRIIEEDITKELGISRTSVRSAFSRLQNEGFVSIVPNKGTYVFKPTKEDFINIYHARRYLEMGAMSLAIPNMTNAIIQRLEQAIDTQKAMKENFLITEYAVLNRAFHEEIVRASNNDYYERYLNEIYNKAYICLIFYDESRDNSGSLITHTKMLDAIKNKDIEAGVRAIGEDINLGCSDIFLSFLK